MSRVRGNEFADYLNFKRSQGIARRDAFGKTGLQCPACRYVHPYTGPEDKRLGVKYEKQDKAWVLLWKCPLTGDVIGEMWLGDKHVSYDGTTNINGPDQTSARAQLPRS